MEDIEQEEAVQMPWLLFKAKEQVYAINSRFVVSIFQLTDDSKPVYVAGFPEYIRGILSQRENILTLLDFRIFLGMPGIEQIYNEFTDMLDARKADHLHWVQELERSVDDDVPFTFATDPHKCAFGQWYYSYKTNNRVIQHHLNKIEEPHRKLHESAQAAFSCKRECEFCKREKCLRKVTEEMAETYMPELMRLLDEAKKVFWDQYREMCIVLRQEEKFLGMAVDEILEVENLEIIPYDEAVHHFHQSKLISGIAKLEGIPGQILVLNEQELFSVLGKMSNI